MGIAIKERKGLWNTTVIEISAIYTFRADNDNFVGIDRSDTMRSVAKDRFIQNMDTQFDYAWKDRKVDK